MRPSGVTTRNPHGAGGTPGAGDTRRMPAGAARDLAGQVFLGKYKLVRVLGEGSNAQVYLAQLVGRPGELVVVKRIKDHVLANARFRQFFDNEVRSMAKFHHPYAVRLIDASLDDPLGAGIVLEYIPGVTLESILLRQRRLSVERAVALMGPLLHALEAAHSAGIVHRDLKPANLMVVEANTPNESLRVMDFGFAGFTAKPHIQLAELTGAGPVFACGTPAYVSPEMVRGDSVDARGDLYSVGVMFYEMLTGRLPFDQPVIEDLLAAHLQQPPPRFNRVGAGEVPAAYEGVANLLLAKYPSERPSSARALAADLSRAAGYDVWEAHAPRITTESGTFECVDLVPLNAVPSMGGAARPAEPERAEDRYVLSDTFTALMPERLAAAKLRGFIEDAKAEALASEPGHVRVRFDPPPSRAPAPGKPGGSGIFGWLSGKMIQPGREPIVLDLEMQKLDANKVEVVVCFRPMPEYLPADPPIWSARCEDYYASLRKYLMAAD